MYRVLIWLEKLSCRLADHVIATNESYKEMEMARGGVPQHRITIVRNGPDLERFRSVDSIPCLRSPGKTVIAYLGLIGPHDGVDHLLRALKHLADDLHRKDFLCIVMGRGEALDPMKALCAHLGLEDHVLFTGWMGDPGKLRYLCTADICVDPDPSNPYNDRSTMIKIAEYMAAGKPIVSFALPENRFTAGDAAIFVRANDEMEFARALAHLMDDPARRQIMGVLGRHRVEAELSWRHSVTHLLSAYRTVLPEIASSPEVDVGGTDPLVRAGRPRPALAIEPRDSTR